MTEQKPEPGLDRATELAFEARFALERGFEAMKSFNEAFRVGIEEGEKQRAALAAAAKVRRAELNRQYQGWKAARQHEEGH